MGRIHLKRKLFDGDADWISFQEKTYRQRNHRSFIDKLGIAGEPARSTVEVETAAVTADFLFGWERDQKEKGDRSAIAAKGPTQNLALTAFRRVSKRYSMRRKCR